MLKSGDVGLLGFSTADTKLQQSDDSDAKLFSDVVGDVSPGGASGSVTSCRSSGCVSCGRSTGSSVWGSRSGGSELTVFE